MRAYRLHFDAGLDFPNNYEWHFDGQSDPVSPRGRICDELEGLVTKLPKYSVGDEDFHGDCHLHGDDRELQHIPADFLDGNYRAVIVTCKHPIHGHQNTTLPDSSHMDNESD